MQTLLHAFHKDIISLNLHNNSLGVGICSPIMDKKGNELKYHKLPKSYSGGFLIQILFTA